MPKPQNKYRSEVLSTIHEFMAGVGSRNKYEPDLRTDRPAGLIPFGMADAMAKIRMD